MSKREELEQLLSPHMDGKPYIECDEGWDELLIALHHQIVKLMPDYHLGQVKEKFGGLRFYWDPSFPGGAVDIELHDAVCDLVDKTEKQASETCEICGVAGKPSSCRGWYKTVCLPHFYEVTSDFMERSLPGAKFVYDPHGEAVTLIKE